jgi:hypothetical protein
VNNARPQCALIARYSNGASWQRRVAMARSLVGCGGVVGYSSEIEGVSVKRSHGKRIRVGLLEASWAKLGRCRLGFVNRFGDGFNHVVALCLAVVHVR